MVKSDECQSRQYLSNYTPIPGLGVVLFCFVFFEGTGGLGAQCLDTDIYIGS